MTPEVFEIIFLARAGQGAKSSAEILAQATLREGKNVQAFPFYGPQRSGAPTKVFFRVSEKEIRNHEPIIDPEFFVIMDETLLKTNYVKSHLKNCRKVLINTGKTKAEIYQILNFEENKEVFLIDANKIALDLTGKEKPNAVILGKIAKETGIVKLESLITEFRDVFSEKIGNDLTNKNIEAMERGFFGAEK